jgi:hypothetical protein
VNNITRVEATLVTAMNPAIVPHVSLPAAALFALGTWLLYRHLLFGDQFSIHLTLSAALMIGCGIRILPTALVGRANVTGRI